MKRLLSPSLQDVGLECVLMQAWKKTSTYLRTHSWYADTLEIDFQTLRIPQFIEEIQHAIENYDVWKPYPLDLVPAPKSQRWKFVNDEWRPDGSISQQLRPLAHVALRDQVVATAIMLCLADRVESEMADPRLSIERDENRRRVLAYGHRLFCDTAVGGRLRHRWGSGKLYRSYYDDYQTFLERPRLVASQAVLDSDEAEIAIVQSDISKFYDRVTPALLRRQLKGLQRRDDDERFFQLARRVLNWRWSDTERAERHAEKFDVAEFTKVALPQGLAAAGFYANVAMRGFESELRKAFDRAIDADGSLVLLDAAYYVDDFRFVLCVPRGAQEDEIAAKVTTWLQGLLDASSPHLKVQEQKTKVTVEGRDRRFLVPQSRTAKRIQHEVSGTFDMLHGTELIGAIEGFFHTQQRYSSESKPDSDGRTGLLVGVSDMKDETAARFAAGRFRRTFRSLRPLLADGPDAEERRADEDAEDEEECGLPALMPRQLVLSRGQLDERGKLFSALLIEEWTLNPANVRLLRIALDIYPDVEFLEQVLRVLRPGWTVGGSRGAEREVQQYCLAELLRAGATETGVVHDLECLPSAVDPATYHERLIREAHEIFELFASNATSAARLPWYLMQQVFLYLAARNAFPRSLASLGKKGGSRLALYRHFARFLAGERVASLDDRSSYLVIATTAFGIDEALDNTVRNGVSSEFLERLDEISPSTAAALWNLVREDASPALQQTAERIGLALKEPLRGESRLPDLACSARNPYFDEVNLLYLASWLLSLEGDVFNATLTPWQIQCRMKSRRREFGRIDDNSFELHKTPQVAVPLFRPPDWCVTRLQRRRYQIGVLLRFAVRGSTSLYSSAADINRSSKKYRRPVSHWEQQRYSGFQGRAAFGPAWIPLSSFVEDLLFELLRWPGSGVTKPVTPLIELKHKVALRIKSLKKRFGVASQTLIQDANAPPPFRVIDKNWQRPLRIGVVQTITPCTADFKKWSADPELRDTKFRRDHKAHIAAVLESVAQLLRVRETHRSQARSDGQLLDLLVFPELAIHPDDIQSLLIPFVRVYRCILLFGLVYHREHRLPGAPLINSCQWLIPSWAKHSGLSIARIEQGKRYLSKEEECFKPALEGFRPAQWRIAYQWHADVVRNRPLYISASICYDATDLALAKDIGSQNDLYIVCALNQDVGAFDRMSDALHYHMYQGVLVVNNGEFGGSSFYMPLAKPFHRQIFHQHGQPQVSIAFAEISPRKLISRPDGKTDQFPTGEWKTPPAGWACPES